MVTYANHVEYVEHLMLTQARTVIGTIRRSVKHVPSILILVAKLHRYIAQYASKTFTQYV